MMSLVDISIRRAVFAVMLIASLVGLGFMSMGRLGVDLFPDVEFPYVNVTATLDGASAETMESEVTDILEEYINTIDGIETLQSFSSEGRAQILIEFNLSSNAREKVQDVRDKVQVALAELPPDMDPPIVDKVDPDAAPIISVMIAGDLPIAELTAFADDVAKERLQRLDGVGAVKLVGGRERAVRIWLDNERLRAFGVTADDVRRAIQSEHAELPGGRLETAARTREFGVKTVAEVTRANGFADLPVAYRENGVTIRISDVARVEDGLEDERSAAFLNGRRGISLDIRKQSGQNTVEVAHQVKAATEGLRALAPAGVTIVATRDVSKFIESSIEDVTHDVVIAIGLVVAVTFVFLLNFRATIIVALAIPTSLVATFFGFYLLGFSINVLTLLALTVAIGLLVDDAIVVIEAIMKELEEGKPPLEAALDGTRKVGLAVVAGTAATLAVFVPIAFMDGIVGRFFYQYGLTIVFSVSVSLLVALTLTPMLASRILTSSGVSPVFRPLEAFWDSTDRAYAGLVKLAVRFRIVVIFIAFASVVAGAWYAARVPSGFTSRADRSEFQGSIELPLGTGVVSALDAAQKIDAELRKIEHVEEVFVSIGAGAQAEARVIDLYASLTPKQERQTGQFEIMDQARKAIRIASPEAVKISVLEVPWVSGTTSGSSDIDLLLKGSDLNSLAQYGEHLVREMRARPDFSDVRTSFESGRPEAQILFDRTRAGDQGVSARALADTARIALGGLDAGTFEEGGKRYDVRLRLEEDQRESVRDFDRIQVRGADGRLVDIGAVSRVEFASGPSKIDRSDRARKISVLASSATGVSLGEATSTLIEVLEANPPPAGITYSVGGMSERMQETAGAIGFALLLALLALYMVLASQFNSFVQPLLIMVTAPLSFSGAFAGLYYFGMESSLFAQIGLIGLMGIVMKNGILLVDRANQLIAEGMTERDAILQACPERLRPVLMTAFSAIFGMVPVALATSDGAEWRNALGALLIGGLTSSTILTLVVIPAVFMIPSDVAGFVRKLIRLVLWPFARLRRGEDVVRSAAVSRRASEDSI
ncbi:MAG: efflux RND transporter permease subunit [Hyphomonas sp.]|uniref:efflux RND transporter permease subunit n=1 Tax=Hyphomonas sp. TaxID=87 RepID=UPI00178E53E9|nr:efflux RND transporter permease subunit [Hyphomonas sp.]MBA3067015.1 efflux RND transporter permease subunit [Hyphomonas sp.]MBU4062284.1 efflux RND transporter permease subunit [Alphaproteobacteria bacterium]MBU4163209.1 efflux RND transporter permease subunit [Alphaproteobacteria bacterium]